MTNAKAAGVGILSTILLLVTFLFATPAWAAEITVGEGGDYATLQATIDALRMRRNREGGQD